MWVYPEFERRRLLAVAMGCLARANLLALSAASFMPAAGGYAAGLGGPERHGGALAMITGGLTVAIIAGVPLDVCCWVTA